MKNIFVIILLFIGNVLFAQEPEIELLITTGNESTGQKVGGVTVEIYQDGNKIKSDITSSKGKMASVYVPVGYVYLIQFKKDGYVTKTAEINGLYDTPEDLDEVSSLKLPAFLLESIEGVDFSAIENEPAVKLEFSSDGFMEPDMDHLKKMKKIVADLKKKIEKEKINTEKKEEERLKREADYQTYVDAGDKAVSNSNYQIAIEQFNLALKLIDKPEIQTKLKNAKKGLADAEASALKDKNYLAKMIEAKNAFDSKNYENSLKLYKDALSIKPLEIEPKSKISKIEELLTEQKLQQKEFLELVSKGDENVSSENYDLAIDSYIKALDINANDASVITKLENTRKLKEDLANAKKIEEEKEANFNALISSAESLFQKENWQAAKDKYNDALNLKPNENLATSQIKVINGKIAELKAKEDKLKEAQEKYMSKMTEANSAYEAKDFDTALSLYNEAKELKPNEDEPQVQINKIKDAQNLQASNEAAFSKLEKQGDVALAGELFEDAIIFFENALKIKSSSVIDEKIRKAKQQRKDKTAQINEAKLKEEKYQTAIKAANIFYDTEKWDDALLKYEEAVVLKSEEIYPENRINAIKIKLEEIKAKNEADNLLDTEYNTLITEANSLFDADKLKEARSKYSAALEKKSGEKYPIDRIEFINSTLVKQAANKVIEDKYLAELNMAKELFNNKKYEAALSKYNLASEIKSDEQEPKNQIIVINKLINDQKNSDQLEAEYEKLMAEGAALLANNDLTTALDRYKKALAVKENDAEAISKISKVNTLISNEQASELKQKKFDELVKKAKISFNAQNYQDAKLNYTKAIAVLPDATIEAEIKVIDDLIAKNQSDVEQQKLFDEAMKIADNLFDANEYEKALAKYEIVNSIKQSQHADVRINTIKNELTSAKTKRENEAKFNELITAASAFHSANKYQKAIDSYKEALTIMPDQGVNKIITELGVLILNQQSDAQKEKAYSDMIAKGDEEFNNKKWNQSIDYYQKAKKIKEGEAYPDERITSANENIKKELELEADKKYQTNIKKADDLFKSKSLDEAIEYYKKALVIKPNEQHPKDQLAVIIKIKNDKVNEASNKTITENKYKDLVKQADVLFNAENFEASLIKYEKALSENPTDFHVISQIEKVKIGLENDKNNKKKTEDYDKLIAEGNTLMNPGTWNQAKIKYEAAMLIFNKTYPSDQIIICDEMMKKDSGSEAEKAYQKILTVAQNKMDDKNYTKAISLYERALKIRPSDSKPKDKIDEINQLLANQNQKEAYNELIQKADNLFEKQEWKKSREFYVKAYAINNDTYADVQIKKIDELDGAYNIKQYNKMISKADEYFIDKNYAKSKGLYQRAIKFLPNNDNTYPLNRIQEIKDILNPPLAINKGTRNLGKKVIGMTEEEMDALLANDSEQRKFNQVNSVKTITKEITSEKEEWNNTAKESTNRTKDKTDKIAIDQQIKGTIAEVERVKAEKATIEQRKTFDKVQKENSIFTDHARFNQIEIIDNVKVEIAENTMNSDIPRREYEKEVVEINSNIKIASEFQSSSQKTESFKQREYVNKIQTTLLTQDPNNDVARKKTEVFVNKQKVIYDNERKNEVWAQEDAIAKTKDNTARMVDEIRILNIDNDIPRQNTVDRSIEIQSINENINLAQAKNQIDVSYDVKNYTDKVVEEIRIERIVNDIPRQNMERKTVSINDDVADANSGFVINQKKSLNSTKDKITEEVLIQQMAFSTKDKEREDDAENVIDLKEKLAESSKVIFNKNKDVSFATKDYADKQNEITTQLKVKGNNSTVKNQDKTIKSVKEFNKKTDEKSKENQVKVNNTVDYIIKMKDIDISKIDVHVKNQLGKDFSEGVTEEIYQVKDSHGLLLSFVIRRVVVIGGEGNVYEKTKSRYGVTSYTKNGDPVSKQIWQKNTANASLKIN